MIRHKNQQQRGDTIVEVLIAMAVLGIVLATSFAIANRSLAIGRSAQERTEALKVAETQLELLRQASSDITSDVFSVNQNILYCIDEATGDPIEFDPSVSADPIQNRQDPIEYPAGCQLGDPDRYGTSIEREDDLFIIRVRWQNISGGNIDEIEHLYRTYDYESGYSLIDTGNPAPPPTTPPVPGCTNPAAANFNPSATVDDGSCTTVINAPSVLMRSVRNSDIGYNSVFARGRVTNNGGSNIIERGFVYSRSPNPRIGVSGSIKRAVTSVGTGNFERSIAGLNEGTRYYVRAFARNNQATGYSSSVEDFVTDTRQRPSATVREVSDTYTTVRLNLRITDDGDSTINLAYIDIHTNSNFVNSSGSDRARVNLTIRNEGQNQNANFAGLLPNKTYYYRGVVRNGVGTTVTGIRSFRTDSLGNRYANQTDSGRSRYYRSTTTETWGAANARAVGLGGSLVAINNSSENNLVSGFAGTGTGQWIGLNDASSEGTFRWSNGDPVTYTSWQQTPTRQPDNAGNQDYVLNNFRQVGRWNDAGRTYRAQSILEFKEDLRPN